MYILASIIDKRSMTIYGSLWGTTHAGIQMNNRIALSISSFDVATFIYAISLGTNWINIRCMTAYGDFYINSNFSGLMSIGPGDLAGYSFSAASGVDGIYTVYDYEEEESKDSCLFQVYRTNKEDIWTYFGGEQYIWRNY